MHLAMVRARPAKMKIISRVNANDNLISFFFPVQNKKCSTRRVNQPKVSYFL